MTVFEILHGSIHYLEDHRIENPRLNAELLLARSMNLSREGLYIHFHNPIREGDRKSFERMIQRRIAREPLQYILEHQEFWSIDFKVDPRGLIPRPETELLVELTLSILSEKFFNENPVVLDLGTGSGAIAISLAKEVRDLFLVATDISRDALLLAKENAELMNVDSQIEFINGDLFAPFSKKRKPFDLIVSNPPYMTHSEIDQLAGEVRDYEPTIAIHGGKDGLKFYRRISSEAPFYLRKGGWLLLEVGQGQSPVVSEMIEEKGAFSKPECISDLSGVQRVVRAKRQ